mmetsp:Transcript_89642/g.262090  ORF Transcript_89642/g.262090 Transcript_89642/m.262090 type:complete len:91 (+) Transcript_89642:43-315(+)
MHGQDEDCYTRSLRSAEPHSLTEQAPSQRWMLPQHQPYLAVPRWRNSSAGPMSRLKVERSMDMRETWGEDTTTVAARGCAPSLISASSPK